MAENNDRVIDVENKDDQQEQVVNSPAVGCLGSLQG
jgi:hypothetical protein